MSFAARALTPAALGFYKLRYGSIWKIREKMREKCVKDGKLDAGKMLSRAYEYYFDKHGSYIGGLAEFANEPCFPHGIAGIFISNEARIGKDAVIYQQVTIGSNGLIDAKNPGAPKLGDRVYIGAGAKIIGGITVGDNCRIGAGAVVYSDMPENSVAVCAPTRIIQRDEPMDNRYVHRMYNGRSRIYEDGKWRTL